MIRHGAEKIFASKDATLTDDDIDRILEEGLYFVYLISLNIQISFTTQKPVISRASQCWIRPNKSENVLLPSASSLLYFKIYNKIITRAPPFQVETVVLLALFTIIRHLMVIQKTGTKIIFTDIERISQLHLPTVNSFLFSTADNYLSKISEDPSHPLFSRVRLNTCTFKTSSRRPVKYRTEKCRTEMREKSFFQFL